MKAVLVALGVAMAFAAAPAAANHVFNLDTPYASRGACESAMADYSKTDRKTLPERFPNFFSGVGDSSSFLTRAFSCELNPSDGQYYISDHRLEVLQSDWFNRRP